MKYCMRKYQGETEYVTKKQFWKCVAGEFMFGSQEYVDNFERRLLMGDRDVGSTHMFWLEDIDPKDAQRAKIAQDRCEKELEEKQKNDPVCQENLKLYEAWLKDGREKKRIRDLKLKQEK